MLETFHLSRRIYLANVQGFTCWAAQVKRVALLSAWSFVTRWQKPRLERQGFTSQMSKDLPAGAHW